MIETSLELETYIETHSVVRPSSLIFGRGKLPKENVVKLNKERKKRTAIHSNQEKFLSI